MFVYKNQFLLIFSFLSIPMELWESTAAINLPGMFNLSRLNNKKSDQPSDEASFKLVSDSILELFLFAIFWAVLDGCIFPYIFWYYKFLQNLELFVFIV